MQPPALSLTAQTLYAELRDLSLAISARDNVGPAPGSIVRKTVHEHEYVYYQVRGLDGRLRQTYLGPAGPATTALIDRIEQRAEDLATDRRRLAELRAAFLAAGGTATAHPPMRVLKAFADAGMLRPGPDSAVVVGTHAFVALGNLLGVRWRGHSQTQDIDLAADTDIDLAIDRPERPAPDVLAQLEMGFIPVPSLDPRTPSTSFRVRGQELRVVLLTPQRGKPAPATAVVRSLGAPAQRLPFLDYLIAERIPALFLGKRHLVLANVPSPERFALHKLLVAASRPSMMRTRIAKDRHQAAQLLAVLIDDASESLAAAKADLVARGKRWQARLQRELDRLVADSPAVGAAVARL